MCCLAFFAPPTITRQSVLNQHRWETLPRWLPVNSPYMRSAEDNRRDSLGLIGARHKAAAGREVSPLIEMDVCGDKGHRLVPCIFDHVKSSQWCLRKTSPAQKATAGVCALLVLRVGLVVRTEDGNTRPGFPHTMQARAAFKKVCFLSYRWVKKRPVGWLGNLISPKLSWDK